MTDFFWNAALMADEQARKRLGEFIRSARRAHYGTVEAALRASNLNRATWQRAEAGEPVRDDKMVAIERALGWAEGDAWKVAAGGEPLSPTVPDQAATSGTKFAALRAHIENWPDLPDYARRAILGILDSLDDAGDNPGRSSKGA